MLPGDEWSIESGVMATPQDMIKFAHSKAKLLVQLPYYQTPIEARVSRVAAGGEYWEMSQACVFSMSGAGTWFPTNQTRVIEILETPPMDPPPLTIAAVKKQLLTLQEELDERDSVGEVREMTPEEVAKLLDQLERKKEEPKKPEDDFKKWNLPKWFKGGDA